MPDQSEQFSGVTDLVNHRSVVWGAIVLAVLLFAVTNLPWNLDEYDQAKQAFTSFEMVTQSHWFYQHTPNGSVATKPPLVGWLTAGLFGLTRSWELAWHLPSFIASLLLLLLITRSASSNGPAAVFIAAAAFSLNLLTPRLASLVRTDMPLALIVFLIGRLIWNKIQAQQSWNSRDKLGLCFLLTVGIFIKGPIVYAFLLPGIIVFEGRTRLIGGAVSAWSGWWPWLVSTVPFFVWVVGGIFLVPGFLDDVVMREFVSRFGGEVHRSQPFYFYLPHLLYRFAPWSLLLIWFLILTGRERKMSFRHFIGKMSPQTFWLVVWSLGGLFVMSLIPSKRVDRIYPIIPPLCLLLAAQVGALRASDKWRILVDKTCSVAIAVAAVVTTGYVTGKVILAYAHQNHALAKFGNAVRREAAAHGWSYKVIGRDDEGMLLYLRQSQFLDPVQGVQEWNSTKLDGLVVPGDKLDELLPQLPGAVPSRIGESSTSRSRKRRYLFLVRG